MLHVSRLICAVLVLSVLVVPAVAADLVVIPNINKEQPGPSNQAYPFNQGNMRYQQVYAKDQFQGLTGIVESFAYRIDESSGNPFPPANINTQIWFSHTDAGPKNLSDTFDDNMGHDKTLVFDGNLVLSSNGAGFDIVVDVDDVFSYTGQKNLIMEIKVLGPARTTQFDAAGLGLGHGGTDWTDRLWATSPNAPTGSQGGDDGMVTQFAIGEGGCGEKAKLKAVCKKGGTKVKGKLRKANPTTPVTFRLDGGQEQHGQTNNKGKAKATWKKQAPGGHSVTVCDLEAKC